MDHKYYETQSIISTNFYKGSMIFKTNFSELHLDLCLQLQQVKTFTLRFCYLHVEVRLREGREVNIRQAVISCSNRFALDVVRAELRLSRGATSPLFNMILALFAI
ncbi:hypothetical protein HID58_059289, partial [Brassica napus]